MKRDAFVAALHLSDEREKETQLNSQAHAGTSQDGEQLVRSLPRPDSTMLVLFSAPLTRTTRDGRELPIDALNQEHEMRALAESLADAKKALFVKTIFARTDNLRRMLTVKEPVLLHFSGHARWCHLNIWPRLLASL